MALNGFMNTTSHSSEDVTADLLPVVDMVSDHTGVDTGEVFGVGRIDPWKATVRHPLTQLRAQPLDRATAP